MWKPIVALVLGLSLIAGLVYLGTRFIVAPAYAPEITVLRPPDNVTEAVLRAEVAELKSANEKCSPL